MEGFAKVLTLRSERRGRSFGGRILVTEFLWFTHRHLRGRVLRGAEFLIADLEAERDVPSVRG